MKLALFSSKYIKYIVQLTTGSIIAQIITIIVAPILTRLYTPEQIGSYTLILTIVAMFGPVLCGKYDMAIVAADNEKEVMALIVGSFIFSLIFIFFINVGYKFYLFMISEKIDKTNIYVYLLTGILFFTGLVNILTAYNNRLREYKVIATVTVLRSLAQNIGVVILGFLKSGTIGLLLSQFLGLLFGFTKQAKQLYKERKNLKEVKIRDVKNTLIKYKSLPLYSMPAQLINTTSYSVLNYFLTALFGLGLFGYYAIAYRILGLPLSVISMNVSKVFFQKASLDKSEIGNYNRTLKKITFFLIAISIPMVVILVMFAPFMFELAFGEGWDISGKFVQILAPMFGFRFIVAGLTPALIISGKQKLELLMQSIFIICSVSSFVLSGLLDLDVYGFLTMISISYSLVYILFYIIIFKLSLEDDE